MTLRAFAEELAEMAVDPHMTGERDKLVARIGALKGSPERVTTDAIAACRAFQEAAWFAAQPTLLGIRSQATAELQALASILKPDQLEACIDEVTRDIVKRRTPLVSAKAVWDRVTAV